jgi:hypothetical protein
MVNRRDSETRDERWAAGRERLRALAAHPATWVALTAVVAFIDYSSGRYVHPGLLYLFPVGLAAWYGSLSWALALALALPTVRLSFFLFDLWTPPGQFLHVLINAAIRGAALAFLAVIVHRLRRTRELEREVTALRGLLPICMYCKQIQDTEGRWHSVEQYVAARSGAAFTHRVCPVCAGGHREVFLGGRPAGGPTE